MYKRIISLVLLSSICNAQNLSHLDKASRAYKNKNYPACVAEYQQAFAHNHYVQNSHYNAACCASLAKLPDQTFEWLTISADKYTNLNHYQSDKDLDMTLGDLTL